MEYRNIFLANPARLSVQREQLVIEQAEKITVPLEDISSVLIESQQVTLSGAVPASDGAGDIRPAGQNQGGAAQRDAVSEFFGGRWIPHGAVLCVRPYLQRPGFCGDPQEKNLLALPSKGSVRMLVITEKQYNAIELLVGKPTPYDKPQQFEQLMIF